MKNKQYRTTAFLIELLINVFVLCLSCAVLIGVFVEASLTVRSTNRLHRASGEMGSMLQTLKVEELSLAPQQGMDTLQYLCWYDEDWNPMQGPEDAAYVIWIEVEDERAPAGVLQHATAVASTADGEEICRMETSYYRPDEGGVAT